MPSPDGSRLRRRRPWSSREPGGCHAVMPPSAVRRAGVPRRRRWRSAGVLRAHQRGRARASMLTAVMILPEASGSSASSSSSGPRRSRRLGAVDSPVVDEQGRQQLTVGVAARNAAPIVDCARNVLGSSWRAASRTTDGTSSLGRAPATASWQRFAGPRRRAARCRRDRGPASPRPPHRRRPIARLRHASARGPH